MRREALVSLALLAIGCGGGSAHEAVTATPSARAERVSVLSDDRELEGRETFAALVAAARVAANEGGHAEGAPCLVGRGGGHGYTLRSDIALSVEPLPDPTSALRPALEASPLRAGLITRFGFFGEAPILVAMFTPMPPPSRAGAAVVILTEAGASVRSTGAVEPDAGELPLDQGALVEALRSMIARGASPIVLSAEASVRIEAIAETLEALTSLGVPVALGVPLEPGTRPPRTLLGTAREPDGHAEGCAPASGATHAPPARGALEAALAPLGGLVMACRAASMSADAARGGSLRLRVAADAEGRVIDVCVASGDLDDPGLSRCIQVSARGLELPPSSGPYTVELPLRLARDESFDRAPYCL
jgi:hypothetical protein